MSSAAKEMLTIFFISSVWRPDPPVKVKELPPVLPLVRVRAVILIDLTLIGSEKDNTREAEFKSNWKKSSKFGFVESRMYILTRVELIPSIRGLT